MRQIRIDNASRALQEYVGNGGSNQEMLTDILTDLRHWADSLGLDFQAADRQAEEHYQHEKGE